MGAIDVEPHAQVRFHALSSDVAAFFLDCGTLSGRFVGRSPERGEGAEQFFVDRRAVAKLRERDLVTARHAPCRNPCQ